MHEEREKGAEVAMLGSHTLRYAKLIYGMLCFRLLPGRLYLCYRLDTFAATGSKVWILKNVLEASINYII